MSEIRDYILTVFYRNVASTFAAPEGFVRRSVIATSVREALDATLDNYQAKDAEDTQALAEHIFDEFHGNGVIQERRDLIAGSYFRVIGDQLASFRKVWLSESSVQKVALEIGPDQFFRDVFDAYLGRVSSDFEARIALAAPASDRVVSLNHNQINEFERPLEDLVAKLQEDNGVPDSPDLRERLLGEVKAGRELLRAGTFRAYLLYVTLIRALGELIERYKGHAIAMIAASLVDLLVKTALQAN
jgi:hypothetical protein